METEEKAGTSDISEREAIEGRPLETEEAGGSGEAERQPDADPRLAGKSVEDLRGIIREQEKLIGRQANEVGDVRSLKQELAELRGYVQAREQRERAAAAPPPEKEKEPEFDIVDPAPYIKHVLQRELSVRDQMLQRAAAQRAMTEAQVNFYEGREAAFKENPDLFAGIESKVEEALKFSFDKGVITAPMLRSPKAWTMAAKVLRIERGEDELIVPRKSMKAIESEKPGRPSTLNDEDIILDEEDREVMKEQGWSEKEAKEYIRTALDARRRGLQVDSRN